MSFQAYDNVIDGITDPWPTTFTRPNITHFDEQNRRPDLQKIIYVKKVNSRFLSKYKEILISK